MGGGFSIQNSTEIAPRFLAFWLVQKKTSRDWVPAILCRRNTKTSLTLLLSSYFSQAASLKLLLSCCFSRADSLVLLLSCCFSRAASLVLLLFLSCCFPHAASWMLLF